MCAYIHNVEERGPGRNFLPTDKYRKVVPYVCNFFFNYNYVVNVYNYIIKNSNDENSKRNIKMQLLQWENNDIRFILKKQ